MSKKRLLFAASEVYPFAKTGGLADVAHALPKALTERFDVDVVMPLYQSIDREQYAIRPIGEKFEVSMGNAAYEVQLFGCTYQEVRYRFVYSPLLCEREFLYGPPHSGYEDNALRFGIFNYALLAMMQMSEYAIAHLNDWQCALVALLLHERPEIHTRTLFTIHNLAYQGTFPSEILSDLGIDEKYFTMEGIEFYGQVSFMKAAIAYADAVTTVSPTYAKEILTEEFGCGLEGFLRAHRKKLVGILNGIDTEHFSPQNDTVLLTPYSDLKGKRINKSDYLKSVSLKGINKPLFVFIGRFTGQKGMQILIDTLPKLAGLECNVAILGEGEESYREEVEKLAHAHRNVYFHFGYDEVQSHRMYAAADFLLMPSLFEPCGLNQLIAFAYGAVPIVHHVGGLIDSVKRFEKFDPDAKNGFGIAFERPSERACLHAMAKAMDLYQDKKLYNAIVKHNMNCDFSWTESAKVYADLYDTLSR
ncbi:glycogen synthase [Sulfuricurvum sp.]|uniref:glycogen synthase n=1 Tax=Sulfuricurvum sp. TaxID=2025608 RepID=UPI003BB0BDD2